MKYNENFNLLKSFAKSIMPSMEEIERIKQTATSKYSRGIEKNNVIYNHPYKENERVGFSESNNRELVGNLQEGGYSKPCEENSNVYEDKRDTASTSQGVIDSIAEELTTVRLQQAIILSEIVGKPRSKTRRKRRF